MVAYNEVTALDDTHIEFHGHMLKKGSLVVAMINAAQFNDTMTNKENDVPDVRQQKLHQIAEDLEEFSETIDNGGVFDYFKLEEWFDGEHYGRAMIAAWWLLEHPEAYTPKAKENLRNLLKKGGPAFQQEFTFVYPDAKELLA